MSEDVERLNTVNTIKASGQLKRSKSQQVDSSV